MKLSKVQWFALEAAERGTLRDLVNRGNVKVSTVRALRVRGLIGDRETITEAARTVLSNSHVHMKGTSDK